MNPQKIARHNLFDHIPVMMLTLTTDLMIVGVNQRLLDALGFQPDELVAQPLSTLLTPTSIQQLTTAIADARLSEQWIREHEFAIQSKSEGAMDVIWATQIIKEGEQFTLNCALVDITRRKKREQALEISEQRFRAVFNQAPIGIAITHVNGNFIEVNPTLTSILGYQSEDYQNLNFLDITHVDDIEKDMALLKQIESGEVSHGTIEKRYIDKSGRSVWVTVTATLIRDEMGIPQYGIGMTQNISRQKASEVTAQHFQTVFETSPIGMAMTDMNGRFIKTNQAFQQIFQYSDVELSELSIVNLTTTSYVDRTSVLVRETFNQHTILRTERRYQRKDGESIWCDTTTFDMRDEFNRLQYVMYIVVDVTERRQLEAQQKLAYQTLEQQVEERTHEIEQRRRVSDSLRDILAILNSNNPLDDVVNELAVQGTHLLQAAGTVICSIDRHDNSFNVRAVHGIDSVFVEQQNDKLRSDQYYARLLGNELITVSFPDAEASSPRTLLVIPFSVEGEIDGCVHLYYADRDSLTSEEKAIALTYCDQVALAIINAHLRKQIKVAAAIEERNRLARDLHDAVSQTLWSASLIAEILPDIWGQDKDKGRQKLEQLKQLNTVALAEMRSLLMELRPQTLESKPLEEALVTLSTSIEHRTGIRVIQHYHCNPKLPTHVKVTFYRIAQEALNNVTKHANASEITLTLNCVNSTVILQIQDNGKGFDPKEIPPDHFGLGIMKERAGAIHGKLEITSTINMGTGISLIWEDKEESNEYSTAD